MQTIAYFCGSCSSEIRGPLGQGFPCPLCGAAIGPNDAIADADEALPEPAATDHDATDNLIRDLRAAGLDAWDTIDDPEQYLRELRGDAEPVGPPPKATASKPRRQPKKRTLGLAVAGTGVVLCLLLDAAGVLDRLGEPEGVREVLNDGIVVTREEYDRIRPGMTYRRVQSIVGVGGEELSSNRVEGVPGVMPGVDTVMYAWQNDDGSNITAMFQNGALVQKAQFGLRSNP